MSYQKFEHSIPNGDEVTAYEQLRRFFELERQRDSYQKIFATSRLFDVAGGVGFLAMAKALSSLVIEGVVDQIVRVEPKFGEGIGDFQSIEEVPDVIPDWRNPGVEVRVLPEHLRIYYKLHRQTST